jgi:error-prone DNA polymerase
MRIGALVVASQRPGTARGITFMLIEGRARHGQRHRRPKDHERDRRTVRTELLIVVEGRPERHRAAGGAINVVASRVIALRVDDRVLAAQVKDFDPADEIELARRAASSAGDFALSPRRSWTSVPDDASQHVLRERRLDRGPEP